MAEVETRKAELRDVDALVELRAEMFRAMGAPEGDPAWLSNVRERFAARIDAPLFGVFVVESEGRVVACAMGAIRDAAPSPSVPDGRDVLISNVCTRPDRRGRGHGLAAFDAVMRWAGESGVSRAELMATSDARDIYERAGFAVTHFPAMRASLT